MKSIGFYNNYTSCWKALDEGIIYYKVTNMIMKINHI